MYDNPTILNLHLRLWDSYMNMLEVRPKKFRFGERWKAEGWLRLPTWLWLGVKIVGNGILGVLQKKNLKSPKESYKR